MSNSGSGQGIYSPLRQNITDSESEEEIHSASTARNQIITSEKINKEIIMKNGLKNYQHFSNGDEIEDPNGYAMGLDNNIESVSILQSEKSNERMSPLRKVLFVLSILVCFLTIVVFLWILPCTELGECSAYLPNKSKRPSWENPYHDIELKGAINIVDGAVGHDKNLIMLFRGDIVNPEHPEGVRVSNDNGIILIVGNSGKVGWFIRQPRLPTDVDCSLIDVDNDGSKDCIVIGKEGLFAAFNPTTGTVYWYLHSHESNSQPFLSVDFPLILMDIDGDGISDMLAPCSTGGTENLDNSLIFISGYRGSVIGQPLVITECTSINKLQIDKDHIISFTCKNNTSLSESLKVMKLEKLHKRITNKPFNTKWNNWAVAKQHQVYGQRKETENQRNVYSVDGRKLIVENQGHCPKNCKVTVQLIDERTGKENISWEYIASRVYGMVPATLVFNNSANILKHHISGFVLKFWQWNINPKSINRFDRNTDNNYNIFNNIIDHHDNEDKVENLHRFTRNTIPSKPVTKNDNFTVNRLTERVVLVTFNATDIHIVNASQSDVLQICIVENKDSICQPDLSYQENSLLISDLDGDGSQELITYLTSFTCPGSAAVDEITGEEIKCDEEWKLRSTVRVVRLEAELPKLYEAVSHH